MVLAMCHELGLRKHYLDPKQAISTIYFGGGTPSILPIADLQTILEAIYSAFELVNEPEITIEVNPDDINTAMLQKLQNLGFNRLSIGIQSFYEEDLRYMNRAHNAQQAKQCIQLAQDAGFYNISTDLICGYPLLSNDKFYNNLDTMLQLQVPHLSCYNLTVEPNTALHHQVSKGTAAPITSEHGAQQFTLLMQWARQNGYQHYEISNFAQANHRAIHNTNYWSGAHYLGIGPGAHSYNGASRQWNVANNNLYIKAVLNHLPFFEMEQLSPADKINEYILTNLRRVEGLDIAVLQQIMSKDNYIDVQRVVQQNEAKFQCTNSHICLSDLGKLYADALSSDMFVSQ
jgi:oxygen-independent coproporphyrinogen III oxidase